MFKNADGVVFHEITLPTPLWEFIEFCEIYCSASCCEYDAFEQHHSLIRRKIIDINIKNRDGDKQFITAHKQLKEVVTKVRDIKATSEHDQISIRYDTKPKLQQYQLDYDKSQTWFNKWLDIFNDISK